MPAPAHLQPADEQIFGQLMRQGLAPEGAHGQRVGMGRDFSGQPKACRAAGAAKGSGARCSVDGQRRGQAAHEANRLPEDPGASCKQ